MAQQRYFALRTTQVGRESAVFTGSAPRQAALKAASRGHGDIFLRERGSKKLHHFRGSRKKVRAPANKPDWMADTVWKPNVKKVGLIRMEAPKKKVAKKRVARRAAKRTARKPARRAVKRAAKKRPAARKAKRRR